ncbi:MAG: peptidyl-prolyl cis-trans isomerase, partial [Gammaproteobacteria bacterium]|nr:peptidyl-prolyl cis-trans isomerase [Gammaproteobacteria bacterium]
VEREAGFLASHFGTTMAERLFALAPDESRWQGPLESPYGFHLVLLTRKVAGRYPELAEIRSKVRYDAERAAIRAQQDAAIQAIVDTYEVRHRIDGELVGAAQ